MAFDLSYWHYVAVSTPLGIAAVSYIIGSGLVALSSAPRGIWFRRPVAFGLGAGFGFFKTLALGEAIGVAVPWYALAFFTVSLGVLAIPNLYLVRSAARLNRKVPSSHGLGVTRHDRYANDNRPLRPGDRRPRHHRSVAAE